MGRPKKDIDTEAIGVRITKSLLTKLDDYAAAHKISRSAAAVQGIKFLVNSKECISCGTLNAAEGKCCCSCGTPLYDDVEILGAMESIIGIKNGEYNIQNKAALKKYLDDGLTPVFKLKIKRGFGFSTKYCIETRFKTQTGMEMHAADKALTNEEIDEKTLLESLPGIKKEFDVNPDAKERIRKIYLDESSNK